MLLAVAPSQEPVQVCRRAGNLVRHADAVVVSSDSRMTAHAPEPFESPLQLSKGTNSCLWGILVNRRALLSHRTRQYETRT
jgi:hypothetical protein